MSMSNFLEAELLDHVFTDGAFSPAATPHAALCSLAPVEADTGTTITEVVYTGYARALVDAAKWGAAVEANPSTKTNGIAIPFPIATAGSATATHFAICSALTVGDLYWFGMLASNQTTAYADDTNNIIISETHGFIENDRVSFLAENMPGGINANQAGGYWVIAANLTADTFQFSTTMGGGAFGISSSAPVRVGQTAHLAISLNITPEFSIGSLILGLG